jgi:hypothetical protein
MDVDPVDPAAPPEVNGGDGANAVDPVPPSPAVDPPAPSPAPSTAAASDAPFASVAISRPRRSTVTKHYDLEEADDKMDDDSDGDTVASSKKSKSNSKGKGKQVDVKGKGKEKAIVVDKKGKGKAVMKPFATRAAGPLEKERVSSFSIRFRLWSRTPELTQTCVRSPAQVDRLPV